MEGVQRWLDQLEPLWQRFVERVRQRDPVALAWLGGGLIIFTLVIFLATSRRPTPLVGRREPPIPAAVRQGHQQEPRLRVYFHEADKIIDMDIEDYLLGVVAAEMEPTWPRPALEAQAIIARTFTLERIESTDGVPERSAHASTDHKEFQAYDADRINDNVHEAIGNTRGQVVAHRGRLARTWFHAYSGGQTASPPEGLNFQGRADYVKSVVDKDLDAAIPDEIKYWTFQVPAATLQGVVIDLTGTNPGPPQDVVVENWTPSGRAETIAVNGVSVGANDLRSRLGGEDFKSTMLKQITVEDDVVLFAGKGYGHGVGLSQWGAKVMAEKGEKAEEIVGRYYEGTYLVRLWR